MNRLVLTEQGRRYGALALVVAVIAATTVLVIRSDSDHATKYQLHDSGIWGTRTSDAGDPVGRLNYEIQSVDMAPPVDVSKLADPDVFQNDANVVIYSKASNMLAQVAVAQASVQPPQPVPADAYVGIGGESGAVFAPSSGSLWVTQASSLGSQSYTGTSAAKPTRRIGRESAVVVGTDGTTHAYDPVSGKLVTISGTDAQTRVTQKTLPAIGGEVAPQITAVGDQAVILDSAKRRLLTSSGATIDLPSDLADSPVLQQPSDGQSSVLVASTRTLATVPLHGGAIARLQSVSQRDGSYGPAVAPVALGGCSYGAWKLHGQYARFCSAGEPVTGFLDRNGTSQLPVTWRVNRGRVALNNQLDGAWVTFDPLRQLGADAWITAFGIKHKNETNTKDGTPTTTECKDSQGPTTSPFEAGARPGSSVVIPVIEHDVDPSHCRVLAIVDASTDVSGAGTVAIADQGRSLLFTPAGNQPLVLLNYTVSDGVHEGTGTVTVHVYGPNEESPPQLKADAAKVQLGHRVTFNVLANDTDREGDPIRLLKASIDGVAAQYQPTVRANGEVTVTTAPQHRVGQRIRVVYSASDDRPGAAAAGGAFDVAVQAGVVAPTAAPDFGATSLNARTASGTRELAIDLLANDSAGSGTVLSLVSVRPIAGQRLRFLPGGEMFFTPTVVGDFSTTYIVSDGTSPTPGRVRVRVTKGGANHAPVALPDTAQLRSDGNATVDVLDNDTDADADVLFVSSVTVAPNLAASLHVAIVDHAQLRIGATTQIATPITVGYTVTDGVSDAQGIVTVLPPTSIGDQQPPVARDDQATVRVNGAAEIPVLANDFDPNGGSLSISPKVPFTTLDGSARLDPVKQGLLYVHRNTLRFVAPATPGAIRVNYNVTNGYATSTGQLSINVIRDDQANQPPQPPPLVSRVFAGSSTSLTIPLLGVDPENDPVNLVGLGAPPSRGVVASITGATLVYRADPADQGQGGTDMFTYWLRDDHGALGEGTVLIAVSPPPLLNTAPVAEDDSVRARPGTRIRISVTANDVDADGDPISVVTAKNPILPTKPANAPAPIVEGAGTIEVTVPAALRDGTQISFFYGVTDGINPPSAQRAQVTVTVDRHAIDLPVAVDDIVPGTHAPSARATVTVPVLKNDLDPAYDQDQLTIAPSFNKSYRIVGNQISIPAGVTSRLISYCIQNPEHSTACAFVQITVGDPKEAAPVAVTDTASVSVGGHATVDVTANDTHAPGKTLRVTTIVATRWGDSKVTNGKQVTFTPTPNAPGYGEVIYQVTDGTQSAVGIFFITVKGNQPPVLEGSAISIAPGDHVDISLVAHVLRTDSTAPTYRFEELSRHAVPGISADLHGDMLAVGAATSAIGQTASVVLRVSNGRLWSRAAMFQITVTQPPAPQASSFSAGPFKQGSPPQTIDVLAHVTDPVGKGLRILNASVDGAAGTVRWSTALGGTLQYSPSASFSGQTQIFATIGDTTGKADRRTVATITVAVYGPPTRPTVAPTVTARTDTSTNTPYFALDWSAGPALPKGAAIDHYEVNFSGGDTADKACPSSGPRCGFSGLDFAKPYVFKVRAVDIYEEPGAWGPASSSQKYDVAPPAVLGATAQFDVSSSTSIDLAWTPPTDYSGSKIQFYDIYIGTQLQTSARAPLTSVRIDGLTTGQAYEFTIKTRNASDQQSDAVTTSPPVRPLAVPTFVPTPVVSESLSVNDSVDVSWPTPSSPSDIPATGGDDPANLTYFVIVDGGAPQPATNPGFYNFSNPTEGHAYQIKVGVANSLVAKTCSGPLSGCARYLGGPVSFTTYGAPDPISNLATNATASQQLSLTFTAGNLQPGSPADLQSKVYLTAVSPGISGVDVSQPLEITSGWSTPANLSAGQQYSFALLACAVPANTPSRKFCETSSQSTSGTPYGPPGAPTAPASSVNGRTITWNWNGPNDGCGGCGINHYVLTDFGNVSGTSQAVNYSNYSTNYCVTVTAVNNKNVTGPPSEQRCATTGLPPPPQWRFTVSAGVAAPRTICQGDPACRWWSFHETDMPVGTYTLRCYDNIGGDYGVHYTINITSASWSFVSGGSNGYCANAFHGRTVWATLTGAQTYKSDNYVWP